jgi:hypothetical protein
VQATDKLSILSPDPYYASSQINDGKGGDKSLSWNHVSYVDVQPHLQGNLVNIANAIEMQAKHQLKKSLHPDPSTLTYL